MVGLCGKICGISRLGSRSIYVFVDIYTVKMDRDLVAPCQVVGSTIESCDVIKLECEWCARFSNKRRKGSRSRACGVGRRHSDAVISLLGYRIDRSCMKARAPGS